MKPILIIFSLLFLSYPLHAQQQSESDNIDYAVINDTDGYVNVRNAPSINAPIIGKVYENDVFIYEENHTNWWKIYNLSGGRWSEGYVYGDKISLLKNWKRVIRKKVSTDSVVFKNDSLTLVVKKTIFHSKQHKLLYQKANPKENTGGFLDKIDNKRFFGTDGGIPRNIISSIKLLKNGSTIYIPKDAFTDLYEPNLETLSICSGLKNTLYIRMDNSDGAGGYTIIWIIRDNKYSRRCIDTSSE